MPSLLAVRRGSGALRGTRPSLLQLQQQADQLELTRQQFGAPEIEQDKPGLFMTVLDLLSRPNYAITGIYEELTDGTPSVLGALGRATQELFSGIGPIEGEKRAFAEAFERQGYGTTTLGDVIPFLEGTWVGHAGSRGALGLAADIFLDPLTYMTFGTGAAVKLTTKSGRILALNKRGRKAWSALEAEMKGELDTALKSLGDADNPFTAFKRSEERLKFANRVDEEFVARFADRSELFDPGGIKMFGGTVVKGETLSELTSLVGAPMAKAMAALPGGQSVIDSTVKFGRSFRKHVATTFSPYGELSNLPPEMRARAIRHHQNFVRAYGGINGRLNNIMRGGWELPDGRRVVDNMEGRWSRLKKADPDIGKKFYDLREGTTFYNGRFLTRADLSQEELELFDSFVVLHDEMAGTLESVGIFKKGELRDNYFARSYSEDSREAIALHQAANGARSSSSSLSASFTNERMFDTFEESVEVSKKLNKTTTAMNRAAPPGQGMPIYPVLEPNFDLMNATKRYVDKYAHVLSRKSWREQVFADLGVDIAKYDMNAIYDLDGIGIKGPRRDALIAEIKTLEGMISRADARPGVVLVPKAERVFYRGSTPGDTRRIDEPFDAARGKTFAARREDSARMYGSNIERIEAKPGARILDEESSEFWSLIGHPKPPNGSIKSTGRSVVDAVNDAVRKAEAAGYDAISFTSDSEIGTVILREDAFVRNAPVARGNVDTLTRVERPFPLSDVDPKSLWVHEQLSYNEAEELLTKVIANPDYGKSQRALKQQREWLQKATPEELDEWNRVRAFAQDNYRKQLDDIRGRREANRGRVGRAPIGEDKAELAWHKEQLARARKRLDSDEVSDAHILDTFFDNSKSMRDIEEEFRTFVGRPGPYSNLDAPTRKPKKLGDKGDADPKVRREMQRVWKSLKTDAGREEFMARLLQHTKDPSQYASFVDDMLEEGAEFLPRMRAIGDGEVENAVLKYYGQEGAQYRLVTGKFVEDAGYTDGIMLPQAVWDDMEKVNSSVFNTKEHAAFRNLLRGFDWLNNTFKLGVYTFWPASLSRDLYSNVFLSGLDIGLGALDPNTHKHASKLVAMLSGGKGSQKLLNRFGNETITTAGGGSYRLRDLYEMAQDMGVYVPGRVFAEAVEGDPNRIRKFGKFIRGAADKRGFIENEQRLVLWLKNIQRGASPRESMERVRTFLFQYGELSNTERTLFRRLIPFYSFSRFNLELQAKMLRNNPGKVINQVKPFRQRDSEKEMMTKWEREALSIRLDRDGESIHVMAGIDLPLRNISTVWAGGVNRTGRQIMGMLAPTWKVPAEALFNKDLFTGRDLDRVYAPTIGRVLDSKATPQSVKNWLGFKKRVDAAGRPEYTFDGVRYHLLFRSWMFSRALSVSDRQFRDYIETPGVADNLMDFLVGMRRKDLNMSEQQRRVLQRRIRQLQESLVRRGVMREFTRPFEPKDNARTVF